MEICFVQDKSGVFDLCEFKQQLIIFVKEFDRISFFACLGQREVYIAISANIYVSGDLIYFDGDEGFDQKGIAIDKDKGVPGPVEQRIPEGLHLSAGKAADHAVSSADKNGGGECDIGNLRGAVNGGRAFDGCRFVVPGGVDKDDAGVGRSGKFLSGNVFADGGFAFPGIGLRAAGGCEKIPAALKDDE